MPTTPEHFVYVYRDASGNPVYFGRGKSIDRPGSHQRDTHNAGLKGWLATQSGNYRIEIIGPLGDEMMAEAIESALISACQPAKALKRTFFNVHPGTTSFRFRPFGVPTPFAQRTTEPIDLKTLTALWRKVGRILFVRINQKTFDGSNDGRVGYDLGAPPSDKDIRARVEAWWQLANRVPEWSDDPTSSPALLVGVTGGPGAQFVIASLAIDRNGWRTAEQESPGLLRIPLVDQDLDAEGLRGRPIQKDIGLRFNSFRNAQFRIFEGRAFE